MPGDGILARQLLDWYDKNKRQLPWRGGVTPYQVFVSEVMLQQTRVEVVFSYYTRFMERFPTLEALAMAAESDVLAAWSGLGYYSRGRRLHQAAQKIVSQHQGVFPEDLRQIRALPGVGAYTAGAIASIAFGQPEPAIDGNVQRVFSRLNAANPAPKQLEAWVRQCLPATRPGDFNQALMDLGSQVCTPRSPQCPTCPLASLCNAYQTKTTGQYPALASRKKSEDWLHLAVWITDGEGRALLQKRGQDEAFLRGLWHLPGIFIPAAKTLEGLGLLERWMQEKLQLKVSLDLPVRTARHQITHHRIGATAYRARLKSSASSTMVDQLYWSHNPAKDGLAASSLLRKLWVVQPSLFEI